MFFELSVIIFALSFLLFTIYSILYLIQLRRTAKNIESILNKLDQSLPGIISKIDAIVSDLSETSRMIKMQTAVLANATRKIEGIVDDIADFEQSLRREIEVPVSKALNTYNALIKGVRAFVFALYSSSRP